MAKILIIEDEKSINDLIAMNLSLVGHNCFQAFDGAEAQLAFEQHSPELVILDVMIPYCDGFSLMENRAFNNVPVVFLTAKSSVTDVVKGLNLGADDYITKPFEAIELIARIDAVLRRTLKNQSQIFCVGGAEINLTEHKAYLNKKEVELTNREFELMEVLIRNRNIALSREKLLDLVWGYDYIGDTRTVDVHIAKLRKKLGLNKQLKTVYKLGYRLEI